MNDGIASWLYETGYDPASTLDMGVVTAQPLDPGSKVVAVVAMHPKQTAMSTCIAWMQEIGFRLDTTTTRQTRDIAKFLQNRDFVARGLIFKRDSLTPTPGQDALFSWVSGDHPEFFLYSDIFLKSLRRQNLDCDKYIFTHDLSLEAREKYEHCGFRIVDISPLEVVDILVSRFHHWRKFLAAKCGDIKHVLFCDSKDVIFQGNPFKWSHDYMGDHSNFILGFSEGWKHKHSQWNTNDQIKFSKWLGSDGISTTYPFAQWEVLNAGVILGTPKALSDLCRMVEEMTIKAYRNQGRCTDQASLNYIFRQRDIPISGELVVVSPKENAFVAHGEPILKGMFGVEHKLEDATLIHTGKGQPFVLFHQWERTKYRDEIFKGYISVP